MLTEVKTIPFVSGRKGVSEMTKGGSRGMTCIELFGIIIKFLPPSPDHFESNNIHYLFNAE
jgi:hypothetical protein